MPQEIPLSTPTVNLPPAQVEISPQVEAPPLEIEEELPAKNFIHAKYFLNGKHINDYQDNLVEDTEIWLPIYIPAEVWQNNSHPISGTLEVRIENFSEESFTPQLEITFEYEGDIKTKTLSGTILNHGQTYSFNIPLNQFQVQGKFMGSVGLNIKISGTEKIIGSSATLEYIFATKGFPIINN